MKSKTETYEGGDQKNPRIILEGRPLVVQASPLVNVLGTHLYQCTSWCCCERLCSASVNFFEDSFDLFAHFIMGDL